MDVYKVCPTTTFHGRATSDIPLPSHSALLWSPHRRALSRHHDHGMANRNLLCHGGYVPLLGPSRSPLGSPLQKYSQNTPSIFRSIRSCRRIRSPGRSLHPRTRNSGIANPFLRDYTKFTSNHHVYLDHATVLFPPCLLGFGALMEDYFKLLMRIQDTTFLGR